MTTSTGNRIHARLPLHQVEQRMSTINGFRLFAHSSADSATDVSQLLDLVEPQRAFEADGQTREHVLFRINRPAGRRERRWRRRRLRQSFVAAALMIETWLSDGEGALDR